jgi:hypothetical protein
MFTKTKIALSVAVIILGVASAARAGDSGENHQDEDRVSSGISTNAGGAYGYTAAPMHKQRSVHEQTRSR